LLQASNVEAGLDVSVLNAGIYFVEIVTQDGKAIQQFIKK